MLNIGKDLKSGDFTYLDASRSRAVLICGKRGSGKSYTLGVIVEELLNAGNTLVIIIDPMGIYYPMAQPNHEQERLLWDWGLSAKGIPILLLVPGAPEILYGGRKVTEVMEARGVRFRQFRINPADLSPDAWCELFDLSIADVMGIALFRAVQHLRRRRKEHFFIPDIIDAVESDGLVQDRTRQALLNRLEMAQDWDIFSARYQELWEVFDPQSVNIVDLSTLDPGPRGRRNLIVDVLARDIFKRRTIARRKEELGLVSELPRVWVLIDEAQQFVPSGKTTLAKEALIRWTKEGRQPGLSLAVASQQPSAIDSEVITQCDVIIAQKLTNRADIQAVNALSQDYMGGELKTYIRKLKRRGEAVLVDDEQEKVAMVQIRPRKSYHGGGEASV
ncbi:MAG: ATP-binding protein [Anaerolineales bacterium]|nr:ATP-binding protein [Anaerolineales bacterium]